VAQRFGYPALRDSAPTGLGFQLGRWIGRLPWVEAKVGFLTRFLPSKPNARLLDVGAANGSFLRLMRGLGWDVIGIEPDHRSALLAQRHGLQILESSIEDADLPAESVDAITLSHVMEHFKAPTVAVARLAKWLRPGGVLVSISPNPDGWLARRFAGHWRGLEAPRHLVLPSAAGYAHMLSAVGLKPAPWTSLRWFYPSYRQSLGIRTLGAPFQYVKRLRPTLASWYVRLLSWFQANLGEEVVCAAIKPQGPATSDRRSEVAANVARP
jgi:SAM-dependent methyltransferase